MRNLKARYRFLSIFLALVMICGIWTVTLSAGDAITLAVSSASGFAGDTVTVSVTVTNNSAIGAAEMDLSYDTSLLECTTAAKGSLGDTSIIVYSTPGTIHYEIASTDGLTTGGTLFTATFKILNILVPQSAALTLTAPILKDITPADLASTINSGAVTIQGITFGTTKVDASTLNGSNGSITVTSPTGGAGTYDYSKDNGTNWVTTPTFSGLPAGSYNIKVRDRATPTHISAVSVVTLTQPSAVTITSATPTNASVFHGTDGSIAVVAAGGKGTYQYSKDNGVNWQNSATFSNLGAAIYLVKVRDLADTGNVSAATSVTVSQPGAVTISLTSKTDVVQYAATTGSITVAGAGGNGVTYEYTKDDINWQAGDTFSNLAAGVYHIRARDPADHSNISTLLDVTITQPAAVTIGCAQTNVAIFGDSTGSITVTAAGGKGTYEYKNGSGDWQASNAFTGLAAGTYSIQARDAVQTQNVSAASSITITQPAAVTVTSAVKTDVTTYGGADGTITVTANGGAGTYQYSKNNGTDWQDSNVFSGLIAGTYQIKARDKVTVINESAATSVKVIQPVSFTFIKSDVTTFQGTNGSITVTGLGGNGTYEYSKNNGSTWQDSNVFSGLTAGSYQVKTRDKAHIVDTTAAQTVELTQPGAVTITTIQTNVALYGASTGSITITASNGIGTYQYSIFSGIWQDANLFENLAAGVYTVKARDKVDTANVSLSSTITITQPARVSLTTVVTNVTTFTGTNGSITVTAANSTGDYQYSRDNGSVWQDANLFENLPAGTYLVKARDKANTANTSLASSVVVSKPAAVTFTTVTEGTTTLSSADGTLTITALGGKGTYQYSKDDGTTWQDSNKFTGLAINTYKIKVRDKVDTTNVTATVNVDIKVKGLPLTNTDPGAIAPTVSTPSSTPVSSVASSTATSSAASSSKATSSAASSTTTVSNSTTSVTVEAASGVIAAGTELQVTQVEFATPADKKDLQDEIKKAVGNIVLSEGTTYFVYEINLMKNGVETQPSGKVKVRIPLNGLGQPAKVFRIESDGSLTDMKGVIVGGFMVFETDHFSQYVIVNTANIYSPNTGSAAPYTFLFGILIASLIGLSMVLVPKSKRR